MPTPVPQDDLPSFLQPVPASDLPETPAPEESFWQEFARTRQEQLKAGEIKPRPEISMFKTPVKAIGQALATANLPFAYSGIGPLLDVATRRYVEPGAKELLSGMIPPFMRET